MKQNNTHKKKLVLGITFPGSITLLKGQAKYFKSIGYSVYLFSPSEERITAYCREEECTHVPINIARTINPIKDIFTLLSLIKHLKRIKPDIVNVGTPKMGLLGVLAAFILSVPKRVYTCRGLRYEHEKGLYRALLMFTEKLSGFFSHKVVCVGPALEETAIKDKVFKKHKTTVIGSGGSNGVDLNNFNPDRVDKIATEKLKITLGVKNKFVFGFVGRLLDRKGINELYLAFSAVFDKHPDTALIVLGGITQGQLTDQKILDSFRKHPGIQWLGFQKEVTLYMSLFDVLVLPSWWEGFANVLIQSAAMGVPVVSTFGTGCRDAVKDGFNGTLVPIKDPEKLAEAMKAYITDEAQRKIHGVNGLEWAKNFRSEIIWEGLHKLYSTP